MGTPRQSRGFTLIEILVVVVIIGIVLSIAMLSLSLVADDRDVRREAQRLMSILEVAQDDSVLQGREFGVEILLGSYRFVEYDPQSGQWFEILGEDLLRTRLLPEEMEFQLFLEDKHILLDENAAELSTDSDEEATPDVRNYAPHILIFSSGDMTPFELHIRRITDQQSVDIRGDLLGNIEFETDEEEQYE
jgi:general secretion pathway protein H